MTFGGLDSGWWRLSTNSSCPPEFTEAVIVNGFDFITDGYLIKNEEDHVSISGLVSSAATSQFEHKSIFKSVHQVHIVLAQQRPVEFLEEYARRSELPEYQEYAPLAFVGEAYDAMWSMAVGLHNAALKVSIANSTECQDKPGQIVPLENFDYSNEKMGCILRRAFEDIRFAGITVSICSKYVLSVCTRQCSV